VIPAGVTIASFFNWAGIILELRIKDMYPGPLCRPVKECAGASHSRGCNAVEEIYSAFDCFKDIIYLPDTQKMPRFVLGQERDRPFQDIVHIILGPA